MATKVELALSVPPVAVAGGTLIFGYTLPEWAAIITIFYTLVLLARLLRIEVGDWLSQFRRDKP
jgi:hypothetical protein